MLQAAEPYQKLSSHYCERYQQALWCQLAGDAYYSHRNDKVFFFLHTRRSEMSCIENQVDKEKKVRKVAGWQIKSPCMRTKAWPSSGDLRRGGRKEAAQGCEEINDLNNNAALCIHCHTPALHRHRDALCVLHDLSWSCPWGGLAFLILHRSFSSSSSSSRLLLSVSLC